MSEQYHRNFEEIRAQVGDQILYRDETTLALARLHAQFEPFDLIAKGNGQ